MICQYTIKIINFYGFNTVNKVKENKRWVGWLNWTGKLFLIFFHGLTKYKNFYCKDKKICFHLDLENKNYFIHIQEYG